MRQGDTFDDARLIVEGDAGHTERHVRDDDAIPCQFKVGEVDCPVKDRAVDERHRNIEFDCEIGNGGGPRVCSKSPDRRVYRVILKGKRRYARCLRHEEHVVVDPRDRNDDRGSVACRIRDSATIQVDVDEIDSIDVICVADSNRVFEDQNTPAASSDVASLTRSSSEAGADQNVQLWDPGDENVLAKDH